MKQHSTRTVIFLTGIVVSILLSVGAALFFSFHITALLHRREDTLLRRFNAQAIRMLQKESVDLSIVLRNRATQLDLRHFMQAFSKSDTARSVPPSLATFLRMDYTAIVVDDRLAYERLFDDSPLHRSGEWRRDAMRSDAFLLHAQAQQRHKEARTHPDASQATLGAQISGFSGIGKEVFYFSAMPILSPGNNDVSNGTLVFARKITETDLTEISTFDPQTDRTAVSLLVAEDTENVVIGEVQYVDDNKKTLLHSILPSLDDSVILLSSIHTRNSYLESAALIRWLSVSLFFFSFLFSCFFLFSMENWLLHPITHLAEKVGNIDYDSPTLNLPHFRAIELNVLSSSIQNMLERIKQHRTHIEKQNRTLNKQNRKLHVLANYEPHTGLPNKNMFANIVGANIALAAAKGTVVAVIYIDIVNYDFICDARGKNIGEMLLTAIAGRLQQIFGNTAENIVANFGQDDFALAIVGDTQKDLAASADTLVALFGEPFLIETHEISVAIRAGIAAAPFDGESFSELDACATIALNNVQTGTSISSFLFFDHKQLEGVISRFNKIAEIKTGLEKHEFKVVFQPKVDIRTNRITSSEALVRWHTPTGIVAPAAFIAEACESGLIVPLSWTVLQQAVEWNCRFARELQTPLSVGVNVPNNVLLHSDFIPVLDDLLGKSKMTPEHLNVELTEDVLVNDIHQCHERMQTLQQMGVQISLDDFGTGYSSLQYLSKMPFDWIKIDKTFTDGIPDKPEEMAIIAASVGIARSLDMKVVIEGVETKMQWDAAVARNYCDEIQGYYVSKPLPPEEFLRFAAAWNAEAVS